jgi:hypothetical protein
LHFIFIELTVQKEENPSLTNFFLARIQLCTAEQVK